MSHARRRPGSRTTLLIAALVAASLAPAAAHADPPGADPDLTTSVDQGGTGSLVTSVRTRALRSAAPPSPNGPRIMLIGTGVQRPLFPEALRPSIVATGYAADLTDTHGYGTMAASTILQLLPQATIYSRKVDALDASWTMLDATKLARALEFAAEGAASLDAVLLAFPPQAALDPIADLIGHVSYGERYGKGMSMVVEALLANRSPTDGPVAGIPLSRSLRDRVFARANLRQRDAVERYATAVAGWRRVLRAVETLSGAGLAVVAPAGDFTRKQSGAIVPLVTQTVYGLSALPEVITVGAAYADADAVRVSPTSGRGPTLALGAKPDLLAPADVMTMIPETASLGWRDDSTRAPLQMLEWARPGLAPTPCPAVAGGYRCLLQGSSVVSAAVVAANVGALVAAGTPHPASARAPTDDEVLRGIAWAAASRRHALASQGSARAYPWEEGAGVLSGLGGLDLARTPVALARVEVGEVSFERGATTTIPLWGGGATSVGASSPIDSFLGPDTNGAAVAFPYADAGRASAASGPGAVSLTVAPGRAQAGLYAGRLALAAPGAVAVELPFTVVQTVPLDFHVNYAYNEWQAGGAEGERVERATVVLFAGLPTNVGVVGEAFKNFSTSAWKKVGGDPTNSIVIRYATTADALTDPGVPAGRHGWARIPDVPPGFYRMHVLTDHAIDAVQARGAAESLGIGMASSGIDAATVPGENLLIPGRRPCDEGTTPGPFGGCVTRDPQRDRIDPSSGLCIAENGITRVAFHYYCGEVGFAVPTAFVSRAVHLVEHDRGEWQTCGINLPLDGSKIDLEQIAAQASSCPGQTSPTSWRFAERAPGCLAPGERAHTPQGFPADVTATYSSTAPGGLPGRNLPVAVMTYRFRLPYLNTYTIAGLAFSYVAENAIVGVRFRTDSDAPADASNGLLVVDDPDLSIVPALDTAATRGSIYNEWSVMSANASTGQLSLIVIPTRWTNTGLAADDGIARVELCDVGMRILTYAKQAWGMAVREAGTPVQFFPSLDRGLLDQTGSARERVRARWDDGRRAFADAGAEQESLVFGTQIPKDTTTASSPHRVRSPRGGPAYLRSVRRWGTDAQRHEGVLPGEFKAFDPGRGVVRLACSEGSGTPTSPQRALEWETCRLWNEARRSAEMVGELFGEMSVNGRFAGTLAIDRATVARAAGNVAWEIADADDGGAFDAAGRWATSGGAYVRRIPVSDFYDDASSLQISLLSGAIRITKTPQGVPVLNVSAGMPGGSSYAIATELR